MRLTGPQHVRCGGIDRRHAVIRAFAVALSIAAVALAAGAQAPGQIGSPYAAAVLSDSPTAYWRLGDTAGTAAVDATANALNGAYTGGVLKGVVGALPGDPDTAARFDGVNDRINMDDPANGLLDVGTSDFSVEGWLRLSAPTDDTWAGKKGSSASGSWWHLAVTDDSGHIGQVRATIKAGGITQTGYSTARVDDGAWHHIVVRVDRDVGIDFYVDGAAAGSAAGAMASTVTSNDNFLIGRAGGMPYFGGDIDEVAFYRTLLSPTRIAAHYQTGITDSIAPAITLTSPADGSSTIDTTPTFSGSAGTANGDSTTVTVNVYSGTDTSSPPVRTLTTTRAGAAYAVDASPALAVGTYTARAEQSDTAGNTGLSATRTFSIVQPPPDTTAPVVVLSSPSAGSSTSDTTPSFSGTAGTAPGDLPTVTVNVYSGGSAGGTPVQTLSATANTSGAYSVDASPELAVGTYTARAEQSDSAGNTGFSGANTFMIDPPPPPGDPILIGAGDIASCGDSEFTGHEETADLLDLHPNATVFTLGDNVYVNGTSSEYTNCYHPNWGRSKARTKPAAGNHDYGTNNASGYFNYFGAVAGDPTKGYYSYNLGDWHIIVLNSQCSNIGGCAAGSPQEQWLRADLAANPRDCTLAYWHYPRFNSGSVHGEAFASYVLPFWNALYDHGADVILSAHEHLYERFLPQRPDRTLDYQFGIAQFTVGTGGYYFYDWGTIRANSAARNNTTYGVLKLTLHSTSYDFEFVPEAGKTYNDSGSASCHGPPGVGPDTTPPTVSLLTPSHGSTTTDTTPTFSGVAGTATGDSTAVSVKIYGGTGTGGPLLQSRTATRAGDGTYSIEASPALAVGTYTAQTEQLDLSGNKGTSAPNTFTIEEGPPPPPDTTPPVISLAFPGEGTATSDPTPMISGTAGTAVGDSATVTVKVYAGTGTGGPLVETLTTTRADSGAWSVDASPALALGTYTAQAEQADAAGNVGLSNANSFTIVEPPSAPAYMTEVLNDSPRGYWRLGEASGTTAADETTVNPGVYTNGVTLGQPGALSGDTNTAASFDGTNDYIRVADAASLDLTSAATIEAWVKRSKSGYQVLVGKPGAGASRLENYGLWINSSNYAQAYFGDGTSYVSVQSASAIDTNWHHLVATYDNATAKMYVDGQLRSSRASTILLTPNALPLTMGRDTGGSSHYGGLLDEVAVYGAALSATRVLAHYDAGRGP